MSKPTRKYPIETLTAREVRGLLSWAGRGKTAIRNRAIIVTMWRAGLRCAEVLALAPRDVNLERGTVRIRHGKGNKARTVGLDPEACDVVRRWVQMRHLWVAAPPRARLFCTLEGGPVAPAYLRQLLPRLAKRAGIEKRVHPHALRHTFAVELSREGVPIHVIQRALGHANAAATSEYVSKLEPRELITTIRARTWVVSPAPGKSPSSPVPPRCAKPSLRISASGIRLANLPKTVLPPDGPEE